MKTEAKESACQEKGSILFCSETFEKEVKGEREEQGRHDCSKSDAGEIDRPVGRGSDKRGYETRRAPLKELPGEKSDAKRGQGTENSRPKLERGDGVAKGFQCERLEIDEEPFATGIILVEEFIIASFIRNDCIRAVHRFIRIESRREILYIIEAQEKSENNNRSETNDHRRDAARTGVHSVCFSYLVLKL